MLFFANFAAKFSWFENFPLKKMTTAHRPTYHPAKGRSDEGGNRFLQPSQMASSRDLPSHTALKVRQDGQGTENDVRRKDLKRELEARERKASSKLPSKSDKLPEKADQEKDEHTEPQSLLEASKAQPDFSKEDADDPDQSSESSESDQDEDEEDDDDDEAMLMAELARIKKERAEEAARKTDEANRIREKERQEEAIRGNPLLNLVGEEDQTLKRRWDDDVVFKNTCKNEPVKKKRFINDTVRNDFHKKFLEKYVQ